MKSDSYQLHDISIRMRYLTFTHRCKFRWNVNTFRVQWLLYVQPGRTLKISTFFPQSVNKCSVWLSGQRLVVSYTAFSKVFFFFGENTCFLRGTNSVFKYNSGQFSMPWYRLLVNGLSSPRRGFDRRRVHMGFVVEKVALVHFLLRVLRFFSVIGFFLCPVLHMSLWTSRSSLLGMAGV